MAGLRAYLTNSPPSGRAAGGSPYLFVTSAAQALSITAANEVIGVIARNAEIDDLSWHSFRHTWAEALAEELLTIIVKRKLWPCSGHWAVGSRGLQCRCITPRMRWPGGRAFSSVNGMSVSTTERAASHDGPSSATERKNRCRRYRRFVRRSSRRTGRSLTQRTTFGVSGLLMTAVVCCLSTGS